MRRIAAILALALLPSLCLAQALPQTAPRLSAATPKIVVMPYVQPGPGAPAGGVESKRLYWFTDQTPGDFVVQYLASSGVWRTVAPTRIALDFSKMKPEPPKKQEPAKTTSKAKTVEKKEPAKTENKPGPRETRGPSLKAPVEKEQHYFKYAAELDALPCDSLVPYRVKLGGHIIREAFVHTTASAAKKVRCVLVGDMAQGRPYQQEIAYRIGLEHPAFLVALGDIVYPTGRVIQYMHYFWDTYGNTDQAGPITGTPLLASVPLYPVLGNHDVGAKLAKAPDAFGAYYFFTPPKNGPGEGPWAASLDGTAEENARFREVNKDSYPFVDAYSFDNGPAHFVVLNVNPKIEFTAPAFLKWLRDDLAVAGDRWKIVCFHMPGFHSSKQHYAEQQARQLSPLFEEMGVTLTFAGHVHNYQRTLPIKFQPDATQPKAGRFNGQFALDKNFDGVKNTRPSGVIHIVAGGGGAGLYGPGVNETAIVLHKDFGANYADFTAKDVVDKHTFVVLDLAPERIELRALDISGAVLDRIRITKGN